MIATSGRRLKRQEAVSESPEGQDVRAYGIGQHGRCYYLFHRVEVGVHQLRPWQRDLVLRGGQSKV